MSDRLDELKKALEKQRRAVMQANDDADRAEHWFEMMKRTQETEAERYQSIEHEVAGIKGKRDLQ